MNKDQTIFVGDENQLSLKIKLLSVKGSQVKLGFEAPKSVKIMREKLLEKIKRSNINDTTSLYQHSKGESNENVN